MPFILKFYKLTQQPFKRYQQPLILPGCYWLLAFLFRYHCPQYTTTFKVIHSAIYISKLVFYQPSLGALLISTHSNFLIHWCHYCIYCYSLALNDFSSVTLPFPLLGMSTDKNFSLMELDSFSNSVTSPRPWSQCGTYIHFKHLWPSLYEHTYGFNSFLYHYAHLVFCYDMISSSFSSFGVVPCSTLFRPRAGQDLTKRSQNLLFTHAPWLYLYYCFAPSFS